MKCYYIQCSSLNKTLLAAWKLSFDLTLLHAGPFLHPFVQDPLDRLEPHRPPPTSQSLLLRAQVGSMIIFYHLLRSHPKEFSWRSPPLLLLESGNPCTASAASSSISSCRKSQHHSPISSPTHLYKLVISPPLSRTVAESSFVSNSSVSRSSPMTSLPLLPSSSST